MRKRKLKVWNGDLIFNEPDLEGRPQLHVSICAYSQKDAVELLRGHGHRVTLHEFRGYWIGCWGNSMDGIEPERGMWVEYERYVPTRIKEGKG